MWFIVIWCALFFDWRNLYQNGGMPRYLGIDNGYGLWVQHRFQGRSPSLKVDHFTISPRRWPRNSCDSHGPSSMYHHVSMSVCQVFFPNILFVTAPFHPISICSSKPSTIAINYLHYLAFFQDLQPIILSSFYHHVSHFPHVPISIGYLRTKKRGGRREKPEAIE